MTRTEKIIYHAILAYLYGVARKDDELNDAEIMEIVKRAAAEIKDIPVYKPGELPGKLKEGT